VLRSDVLGSLLGYEPSILLVPPRHIAPQARVRVDDRAALMQASLEAHPAYRAIKADESEALGELIAAWWAMTGIIFGGIENPVLGNSTALMGGFTVILEWDYYWAAWLALQGARGDYAVKELQSEMHAEEVGSAMDDALARLEASINSARDALQMQEDAHAAASAALASPSATTRHPLTAALLAQRHATERLVAAIGAVLHYNLSHLEILAALGHLVLEPERASVPRPNTAGKTAP
jgi:hypothetical protein